MLEVNKQVKKRTSKTNPEFLKKKALIVQEKLNNPDVKVRDLQEKYNIDHSIISRTLSKEIGIINTEQKETIDIAKENIKKGFELVAKRIKELETKDIKSQSDLNLFTSTLKNQQNIISMIEGYSNQNNQNNIIPVNIQINIKD